jgi:hypothetical protein
MTGVLRAPGTQIGKALPVTLFRWPVLDAAGSPGRREDWCAGPTEPGNVFVMFFQTPIYE